MNLLLLLSALLSALTGVSGGARNVEPTRAIAAGAVAATIVAERKVIATVRPIAALPGLAEIARPGIVSIPSLIASEPLFASRRRE